MNGTTACKWDNIIPFKEMWKRLNKLIKSNGAIVLFGTEPFSSALRMSNIERYRYDWIWENNKAANFAQAPYMPLKTYENIIVFSLATIAANSKNRMIYNPQGLKKINRICAGKKSNEHRPNRSPQKPFIQKATGYPKQILKFNKDTNSVHPTQKPVALMEYLIKTYTNKKETVLDFTIGSGTTAIAAIQTGRNFIGIEKEQKYVDIAKQRIKNMQPQLFQN